MTRRVALALAAQLLLVALVGTGCSKAGVFHYLVRTDVVNPAGAGAIYLRTSDVGTDMVIFGAGDPNGEPLPFINGTVLHDSTTDLQVGTYVLDASGAGVFEVAAAYTFPFQPELGVAGRDGSQRTDFSHSIALAMAVKTLPSGHVEVTIDGTTHEYTPYAEVVANIDLAAPEAPTDTYQLYNLGLFFGQVRIPAFGSIGMTRYISQTGHFSGLIAGEFDVAVESFVNPKVTMSYRALEDFPGLVADGAIITNANLSGDGPMEGVMRFRFEGGTELAPVVITGAVDYSDIRITNGMASSGDYAVVVDGPTPAAGNVPFTIATNIDLRNFLPETP